MTTRTSYTTVARPAGAEIEVKRSRFRCRVDRVETEEDARGVLDEVRRADWGARHHCSAFVLGPDGAVQRSNDDGEPAGTAGAPMLEVLVGAGVSDTVAVVSRWFGGTLLGAGGLVRAYGDAVRAALEDAGRRERRLMRLVDVGAGHADAGRLESELRARQVTVLGAEYTAEVTLHLATPAGEDLEALLAELSGGSAAPRQVGEAWVDR